MAVKKKAVRSITKNKFASIKSKIIPEPFKVSDTLFNQSITRYDLSSIIITYPFYAKIKRAKNKQYYPMLFGNNHEIVFTGETHKNRNDVVLLIKSWFPQIQVK